MEEWVVDVGIGLSHGRMSSSGRLFIWAACMESSRLLFLGGRVAEKLKGLLYVTAEVPLQADGWYIGYHVY